ncbi:MAG TPA: hypothetical protein GX745_07640 [Clostridiales bacterium]|nr:hypothetical protein [Clostridiales bacterium]
MITGLWIVVSVLMFLLGYLAGVRLVLKSTFNLVLKELQDITDALEGSE